MNLNYPQMNQCQPYYDNDISKLYNLIYTVDNVVLNNFTNLSTKINELLVKITLLEQNNNIRSNCENNELDMKPIFKCTNDEDDALLYDKNISVFCSKNKFLNIEKKNEKIKKINLDINLLDDIITLGKEFKKQSCNKKSNYNNKKKLYLFNNNYYGIDPIKVIKLINPLTKLNNLVGLTLIKDSVINFITHYLHNNSDKNDKMLHTIIEGPPGVGKTRFGKILAEIYSSLGVIPSSKFKLVTRSDLIGRYVGETDKKTQKVIDDASGGVLFIDEAYSLGSDGTESFSKECINCINQNLSENKKKLIVIVAGYKDSLKTHFFSQNDGLIRRFPFKYTIDGYSSEELKDIFISFLKRKQLKLHYSVKLDNIIKLFNTNKEILKNYAGDIENIITYCQFLSDRRYFGHNYEYRKILSYNLIEEAFNNYKKTIINKENNNYIHNMYI